ncbi:MAG: hypothetical protein WCT54_05380 [Patescibacteria group bacterium]
MDWVYQQAFMQFPASTPEGKKQIAQFVLNECRHISHPVERDAWVSKLAKDLDVSPEALRQTLSQNAQRETRNANFETKFNIQRSGQTAQRTNSAADIRDSRPSTVNELEARWLSIVLKDPSLFHEIDIDWSLAPHAELYKSLVQSYNSRHQNQTAEENNPPDFKALYSSNNEETKRLVDYLVIFADREFTDQTADALKSELTTTEVRLHELSLNGRRQQLEQEMRTAERLGNTERINALLEQFKQLK